MIVGKPFTLTGEIQRDYNFEVIFYKLPDTLPTDISQTLLEIFSTTSLMYLSGLVSKIRTPTEGITLTDIEFGPIGKIPVPSNLVFNDFGVTFLEDESGFVTKFLRTYYSMITNNKKISFAVLKKFMLGMIFNKTNNAGLPITDTSVLKMYNSVEVYPNVIPIGYSAGEYSKESSELVRIDVTFRRFPVMVEDKLSSFKLDSIF